MKSCKLDLVGILEPTVGGAFEMVDFGNFPITAILGVLRGFLQRKAHEYWISL
jgi:hypothetical protein